VVGFYSERLKPVIYKLFSADGHISVKSDFSIKVSQEHFVTTTIINTTIVTTIAIITTTIITTFCFKY